MKGSECKFVKYMEGSDKRFVIPVYLMNSKNMPFELCLPFSKPLAVGEMTREEFDAELQKGVDSIKAGKVYSADEVDAVLSEKIRNQILMK